MATDDMLNAGETPSESKPASKSDWETVHEEALEEYERAFDRERHNQDDAYDDLKFRRGRLEDQWDRVALDARKGRPTHVINLLPKFIRQVTGDMRKARPSIKAVPVDSNGDPETAEVLSGMFRYIENRSHAKHIYTQGNDSQVACGIGHWQVTTEYASTTTFNQELRIASIEDGVGVLWDADAVLPTREDAMHCFVPTDMTTSAFKRRWKNAKASGFDTRSTAFENWTSDDYIRVQTYWRKTPIKRTLALMPDGSIRDLTKDFDAADDAGRRALQAEADEMGVRIEQRDSYKVTRYLMTIAEILEEYEWKGMNIPVVPVLGEEVRIGREVYRHGIVRYARDLQRMVNYYASAETEVVALQPKAPWLVTTSMVNKHYDQWENANTDNLPFLEFDLDPKNPAMKPERVQPPVASQAIQTGALKAAEDMKAVIGIYDAALGAKSNETSGVAIARRDEQSDTGTFVYFDNGALSIQRTAKIVMDLIPHYYDTQRMIQIIGEDGKPQLKEINRPTLVDGAERIEHDVTVGAYDVVIEQGPGYATKRQQASDSMTAFIQAVPQAAPLIGDMYAKTQDWPQAEEIGERLEEMLPPPIKNKLQQQRKQVNMRPGQPPPEPPTPEEMQAAQAAQLQEAAAQLELQGKQLDNDKKQAEIVKIMRDAGAQGGEQQPDPMQIARDEIELAEKQDELATKREINAINVQIKLAELEKARLGLLAAEQQHTLNVAKTTQNIEHAEDKHGMGLHAQAEQSRRSDEQHRASLSAE